MNGPPAKRSLAVNSIRRKNRIVSGVVAEGCGAYTSGDGPAARLRGFDANPKEQFMATADLDIEFVLHDLRNVLQTIDLIVGLQERTEARAEVLRRCVRRASTLANDLSRHRCLHGDPAVVDLSSLCKQVVAAQTAKANAREIALTCEAPDLPLFVLGERELLERAVDNLVGNALGHGARAPGGRAGVKLSRRGLQARISVEDDGPGIPAAVRTQIGEPIARAGGDGVCLGLAMVKRTAESHGGWLEIADDLPAVSMVLPLIER
jgi:signal transduction histidine kinase